MSFTEEFTRRISDKLQFKKDLSITSFTHDDNTRSYYVDIRTKFVDGSEERPTKNGVTLYPEEMRLLMPKMLTGKLFEIDNTTRHITFRKKENRKFVYEILLVKRDDDKEQKLDLVMSEIKKISKLGDKIFAICDNTGR